MLLSPAPSVFSYRLTDENECNLTAKISHFSDESIHYPGHLSYDTRGRRVSTSHFLEEKISLMIYANGNSDENEGYVSVFINVHENPRFISDPSIFELTCIVSVIDITGNQRFSRSFAVTYCCRNKVNNLPSFGYNKFVERQTLLSEKSELLPRDSLTIQVFIHTSEHIYDVSTAYNSLNHIIRSSFVYEDNKYKLILDSKLVYKLFEVSEYFRCLLNTDMIENRRRLMEFSLDEFTAFECIGFILFANSCPEETVLLILDEDKVFKLYEVANKYLIQIVLDKCREFMKNIISSDNISIISRIAQDYRDGDLEEAIRNFRPTTENFDFLYDHNGATENRKHSFFVKKPRDEASGNEGDGFNFYKYIS